MSKRLYSVIAAVGTPWLLVGCPSPEAIPPIPLRAIGQSDIIGAWRYAGVPDEEGGSADG